MMRYIGYFFCCILFSAQGFSAEQKEEGRDIKFADNTIAGQCGNLSFRPIQDGDPEIIRELIDACDYKEERFTKPNWAQEKLDRQNAGNPYSGLMIMRDGANIAFLGFGKMPILNYDPKLFSVDIINTYLEFGVTELVDKAHGFAKENIRRVENRGLGMFVPILPAGLDDVVKKEVLQIAIAVFSRLKGMGAFIPPEPGEPEVQAIPSYLIGLFQREDPLVSHNLLQGAGFSILEKEGFRGYYGNPLDMAYRAL